jgi:GntR family transcriptional repressor for pyruvate dehydrogenase complex
MNTELPAIELSKREGRPQEIARKLLDYILSGQIAPGSRIPSERQLAQALGVGRSTVREALKSLGLLGLVEVRQGDGTYLRRPDSELLPRVIEWGLLLGERRTQDLVEVRQHLEVVVARLAAARRDGRDLRSLSAALRKMQKSEGRPADFVEADVAFHLAVARAARNTVLSDLLNNIQSLLHVWIRRVIEGEGESGSSYIEHVPIYDAIERRDPEAAAVAMGAHMTAASARLRRTLESHDDTGAG